MSTTEDVIAELASKFVAAEKERTPLEPIAALYPDLSADDAYRVQRVVVATKVRSGDRVVGKKVGATSQVVQQLLGIDEPIYGSLLESSRVENGGEIPLSHLIHPRVECEIAFLMGQDLAGPGVTVADVLAATEAVAASLEINDPRTRGWRVGMLEAIADNGLAARFVLGDRWVPVEDLDLPNVSVVLEKNAEEVAVSTGAAVLGHPARAVAWLVDKLAEHHQSLEAGQVVLPGSLTPIYPVEAGDRIEAEFEALESVSVRFA
jgi:2-keto-4-pentenoate hydratase